MVTGNDHVELGNNSEIKGKKYLKNKYSNKNKNNYEG